MINLRRSCALVVASLAAAVPVRAQGCDCAAPPPRWSVFGSFGAAMLEVGSINAHLTPRAYPALSRDAISFGGGGFISFGELKLGAEHVRLDAGEESGANGRFASLAASYTMATVGWELRSGARLSVAPTVGVGRGSYVVTVGDRAGGPAPGGPPSPTFDEIADAPGSGSRISGASWLVEPSLAADLLVLRGAGQRRGITLGARVGYRIAPNRPEWEYRGERATGGPVDQAKGPIVRFTLGIGGR